MKTLTVSYSTIKAIFPECPAYYIPQADGYHLFAISDDYLVTSVIRDTEDIEDFESNHIADATSVASSDDALILGSIATNNPLVRARNATGISIIAPTYLSINEAWRMQGLAFVASGNATSICDFQITTEVLMQGAQWWIQTEHFGNTADFSVVDKDNILGLHTLYGLPPGYPIELTKFVKNYTIPSGLTIGRIEAPTVSPVVSGLYVRITYDNDEATDAKVGVNYIWYEKR